MYELKVYLFTVASLIAGLIAFLYCADRRLNANVGQRFLILLIVSQAAAFLSPDVVIYNVVVGTALFWACKTRRMIVPNYLFLLVSLPMTPKVIAVGSIYILQYDVSISLGIAALLALAVRGRGSFSRSLVWDLPALGVLFIYVIASARGTTFTNLLRVVLEHLAIFLLPYLVVSRSMRSFDDLRDALYGLVAGVMALSTLAVYEALHTWPVYRTVADHYGIVLSSGESVKLRAGFLRSPGPYAEPTSFGYVLALGVLAAVGCRRMFANRSRQLIAYVVLAFGILAPQARGAWIGLAVGLVAMDLYDRRYGQLGRKAAIAVAGVFMILAAAAVDPRIASAAGLTAEGQGTVEYRSNLFDRGIEEVRAHPLTGRSPDDVRFAMRDMRQGEGIIDFVNTYLYVALVAGIPGFLLFLLAMLAPIQTLWVAQSRMARAHLAIFRRVSSASTVAAGAAAVAAMIAATSMTGRTTMLAVVEMAFAAVILNNMRVARRAWRQQWQPAGDAATEAGDLPKARAVIEASPA